MASQSATIPQPAVPGSEAIPSNFEGLWGEAQRRYQVETGCELPSEAPFPSESLNPEEVIRYIDEQGRTFTTFRVKGENIRRVLRPMVDLLLPFLDAGAEGAATVTRSGKAVFVAVGVLLKATKGVSGLYDVITSLLKKFNSYLERIKIHLEPSTAPTPALLSIFVKTLVQILIALAIVTKHCEAVTSERWFKTAVFQRTKDYVRVIMNKMDVKDTLDVFEGLTNEELLATAAHTNAIVRKVYDETVLNALRSWLRAPDPYGNYAQKRQAVGSCQWFLDDKFQDWKSRKDGMYWIHGEAGTGKSVLCSSVIDTLLEDADLLLAYFYFDYKDPTKQDCRGLVSSLVFQIGTSFDEGFRCLNEERARSRHPPVYEKILDLLSRLLGLSGCTSIVIDALDECPEPLRNKDLLGLLKYLSEIQLREDVDLRVLVASRPESDIQDRMLALATHNLDFGNVSEHMDDIIQYISAQLYAQETNAYFGWSDQTKSWVETSLMSRSNGIFLWVKLQLQSLKYCTAGDVSRALDELPSDLNETYDRILQNFPASQVLITRARHVFECIAYAQRPLSPSEVAEILSMDFDRPKELPVILNSDLNAVDPDIFILQKCPSLLEVVTSQKEDKTVQFIHRSVQEYLTSDKLQQTPLTSPLRLYKFNQDDASVTLARICLSALLDVDHCPLGLRVYANVSWHRHVSCRIDEDIGELLYRFLHPKSASLERWAKVGSVYRTNASALSFAIVFELCHHTKRILTRSENASDRPAVAAKTRDLVDGTTALHLAVEQGHHEIAQILLDQGALIDDANNRGEIPLHIAAAQPYNMEIVLFLLSHRAPDGSSTAAFQCAARDDKGQTALHHAAASSAQTDICRILIEHGSLVDDTDNEGNTPLHIAAYHGNMSRLKLLLNRPTAGVSSVAILRCRARNQFGRTPLHLAASSRQGPGVCRVLLQIYGPSIDDVDNDGDTPLHCAAAVGDQCMVKFLLELPVEYGLGNAALRYSIANRRGRTALHLAAQYGHADACRVLVEHGASVFDTDSDGNTPLSLLHAIQSNQRKYDWYHHLSILRQAGEAEIARTHESS